jgi:putative transposase
VRRAVLTILIDEHRLAITHACRIVGCSRTAFYRPAQDRAARDQRMIDARLAVVAEHARRGVWKCYDRVRALGHRWNHKALYRVYCALRLNQPRRTKQRVPTRVRVPLHALPHLNDTWAMDFMGDTLYDGRTYRILHVLDEGNREALGTEIDTSLPSERVITLLDQLVALHGAPRRIRCDNGPEFVSSAMQRWAETHGVTLAFIQPGKPNQNAYIERFNRTYRTEVLDAWVFTSLTDVRELSETWRTNYNTERSHDSLGRVPPLTFLPRATSPELSNMAA